MVLSTAVYTSLHKCLHVDPTTAIQLILRLVCWATFINFHCFYSSQFSITSNVKQTKTNKTRGHLQARGGADVNVVDVINCNDVVDCDEFITTIKKTDQGRFCII